ncbi:MAG: bifunctional 5,10-methylene-tetrahydrofolate dehydrogenase/5,10-methylene-tetrahydrofolate cyclohydrolase [Sphingobacteriaceae bacterium]|nr:bifunctional 5,10-methylene-tetrahydrofolate dehydrogenase/5,10-methylene-tetrahydrofolate cyclohydrolase [Sphingobacteriaceae bacterium]MBK7309348.1 bifunctional 5,10-methylene-tetrahydrofolate dehydrogenase/5,10-methylene-tetrahydrofolate cyclohydrolase [Sphingobacteriaceae bacterium]MBK7819002.1 bifunctional 5,10-methylene-tetrahydrofolate dehydrogenase/5,10-methylene-tetrahydrofolate cyclohydrolase [Sphingobacteriaceae bacterium]
MELIDGKKISLQLQSEIAAEVKTIISNGGKQPHLAAVLVGNDGGSETYVAAKIKACENVGFNSTLIRHTNEITEAELLATVHKLNADKDIDGYIVQMPLPKHIDEQKIIEAVDPAKDVDGFHPVNVGKMVLSLPSYISATPNGIVELIKRYKIETAGKHCVVIGRSNIVGSPMSILMAKNNAFANCTVTICHSKTKDIASFTKQADIVICALGKPEFLTADMIKQGAVVIDVGTTRVASTETKSGFKLKGDVNFDAVAPKCSFITPVPGGVGPMTIASLLKNTLLAAKKEIYK